MRRWAFASAKSTIVGARSMLDTGWLRFLPFGTPGPLISSGTRIDSS